VLDCGVEERALVLVAPCGTRKVRNAKAIERGDDRFVIRCARGLRDASGVARDLRFPEQGDVAFDRGIEARIFEDPLSTAPRALVILRVMRSACRDA
jgi:hypothetical protein